MFSNSVMGKCKILAMLRPAVCEDFPSIGKAAFSSHEGLDAEVDHCALNEPLACLGRFHTLQQ